VQFWCRDPMQFWFRTLESINSYVDCDLWERFKKSRNLRIGNYFLIELWFLIWFNSQKWTPNLSFERLAINHTMKLNLSKREKSIYTIIQVLNPAMFIINQTFSLLVYKFQLIININKLKGTNKFKPRERMKYCLTFSLSLLRCGPYYHHMKKNICLLQMKACITSKWIRCICVPHNLWWTIISKLKVYFRVVPSQFCTLFQCASFNNFPFFIIKIWTKYR